MVSSCIKCLLILQRVYAVCQQNPNACKAPFSSTALVMIQRNIVSMQKDKMRAAHISSDVYDFKRTTVLGRNASSQLPDKHADADVALEERGRVHNLMQGVYSYSFDENKSNDRPIDAWLYMACDFMTKDQNLYIPMLLTVEAGLQESFGAHVRVVDRHDARTMVEQVRKTVKDTGKAPLVVGIAITSRYSKGEGEKILGECAEAGAYVAIYNAEPTEKELNEVDEIAKNIGAKEVWDYNMFNVLAYKPDGAYIVRHVPPGYLSKIASEAPPTNLTSSSRDESKIGFLGRLGLRPAETQDMIHRQFGERLQLSQSAWTGDGYVQWVDQCPMQLNIHRTKNSIGLETFRLSMLLTFKACVISAPSDPADMKEWKGIVHFAELRDMKDVFSKVTRTDTGVQDCQLTSFSEFQKRFHPKAIIQKSGLMHDWHPGQAASQAASQACNWQCYLNRYADLQEKLGATNIAVAQNHWKEFGQSEGRDCTCE